MKDIKDLLTFNQQTSRLNRRQEILKEFVDRIHEAITDPKFRKPNAKYIAIRMSHLPIEELESFLGDCKAATSFSKYWYWALKTKDRNDF